MTTRATFLLVVCAVAAASIGCCGPCGQQWRPVTYKNYGPCHSGGSSCGSSCAPPCVRDAVAPCGASCGSDCCGSSCSSCTGSPVLAADSVGVSETPGGEVATVSATETVLSTDYDPGVELASGGCESCGDGCATCGQIPCGCGLASWPNPFAALTACSGCGPIYWSEWHNDPPDICDPCDCHGNWTGSGGVKVGYYGPPRAGSASVRTVRDGATPQKIQ